MLSIIIPTKNRQFFLMRQLRYYLQAGFTGNICIGDASEAQISEQTEKMIEPFRKGLNITYLKFPRLGEAQTTQKLLAHAATPYAIWSGDDDFLIPKGLEECVDFLESHKDYHAAHGTAIALRLEEDGIRSRIIDVWKYNQPIVQEKSATERLLKYAGGDVHYSVHRIESMRRMYKYASLMTDHMIAAAEAPCLLSVIQGSIKQLDCLTLVRGIHTNRFHTPDFLDRFLSPQWGNSCRVLYDSLTEELKTKDSIPTEKAEKISREIINNYLLSQCSSLIKSKQRPLISFVSLLKNKIKKVGIIKSFYRLARIPTKSSQNNISLSELLDPFFSYHKDFMKIYNIITKPDLSEYKKPIILNRPFSNITRI